MKNKMLKCFISPTLTTVEVAVQQGGIEIQSQIGVDTLLHQVGVNDGGVGVTDLEENCKNEKIIKKVK